jgi:hypothetical protein
VVDDDEKVARIAEDLCRLQTQGRQQSGWDFAGYRRPRGEIHFEASVVVALVITAGDIVVFVIVASMITVLMITIYHQQAAECVEANRPGVVSTQRECICRGQSCVAAQRIFCDRCEPTQVEIAIGAGDYKSGFTVTVLGSDLLHDFLRGKCGNEADAGRIACEQFVGEGLMW